MKFNVYLLREAEEDLFEIYQYVAQSGSPINADKIIDNIEETCLRLEKYPERGHAPRELERIGITDYREILYKVYRIIYQIVESDVFVYCIVDGRRDIQELLQQRLLR